MRLFVYRESGRGALGHPVFEKLSVRLMYLRRCNLSISESFENGSAGLSGLLVRFFDVLPSRRIALKFLNKVTGLKRLGRSYRRSAQV